MTTKIKTKAFKMFDCTRKRVFLLPSNAFKVWMYHYSMEGPDKSQGSYPKLETISEALNMPVKLVKKQRRALLLHGWLKRVGVKPSRRSQDASGKFNVPIMMVDEGTIPQGQFYPTVEPKAPSVKTTPRQRGQKSPMAAGSKRPPEVHSETQVDSYKQVDGFAKPFSNSKPSIEAAVSGEIHEPQCPNSPMVEPQGQNSTMVEERRNRYVYMSTHGGDENEWNKLKKEFGELVKA